MFGLFTSSTGEDAISVIKQDHEKVKDLFEQFEKAETVREKKKIVAEAIMELKVHAAIEEEIFYPAVRKPIGKDIMTEADEEHHVAKILIAELEVMTGKEEHYDAKFKVLSENVKHHIKEEEGEMLPKAKGLDVDMEALGKKMLARKAQLMKAGVATFAEEKVVAMTRKGAGDSPAMIATKKTPGKATVVKMVPKKVAAKSSAVKSSAAKKRATTKKPAAAKKSAATKKPAAKHGVAALKKSTLKKVSTSASQAKKAVKKPMAKKAASR